jgi:2-methylcitrate dehydratase PrpD
MTGSRKETVKGIDLLCEDMVSATYEQHSEENVRIFKDRLLDITGCIFGESIVKEDAFVTGYLRKEGGSEDFTKGFQLSLVNAVALNCLYARANDFGCMFFFVNNDYVAYHCSETLIPTGLTLASTKPITGREFIANDIAAEI